MPYGRILLAALLLALMAAPLAQPIVAPAQAQGPVDASRVIEAFYRGLEYIENLKRTVYEPTYGYPVYHFIAEYPDIPVWGKYGDFRWVPPFDDKVMVCNPETSTAINWYMYFQLDNELHYSDRSVWVYTYEFLLSHPLNLYVLGRIRVTETHYGDGRIVLSVSGVSYEVSPAVDNCPSIDGSKIQVYIGPYYAGTIADLMASPWQKTLTKPIPSFRFSLRHVEVLGDLLLQALEGGKDNLLHDAVLDMFEVVFGSPTKPFDLYGAGLFEYPVYMQVRPVDTLQFYDARWFTSTELGYHRLFGWAESNGYVDASSPAVNYPLYPYKSKVVSAAELFGVDGGWLFLKALEDPAVCGSNAETDPLLNAWRGIYYAATGSWGQALSEWYDIVDDYDGVGVLACYSDSYSTVRLATAAILGVLLASRGYITWDLVDSMIDDLIRAQWSGSGYYRPSGGSWVKIFKNDHRGGFIVAYNVAPDGSYGVTSFRPDYTEKLLEGNDMDPEYVGPLPTNAETTLVALEALLLYAEHRLGVDLRYEEVYPISWWNSGDLDGLAGWGATVNRNDGSLDVRAESDLYSDAWSYVRAYYNVTIVRPSTVTVSAVLTVSATGSAPGYVYVTASLYVGGSLVDRESYSYSISGTTSFTRTLTITLAPPADAYNSTGLLVIELRGEAYSGGGPTPTGIGGPGPLGVGGIEVLASLDYDIYWPTP